MTVSSEKDGEVAHLPRLHLSLVRGAQYTIDKVGSRYRQHTRPPSHLLLLQRGPYNPLTPKGAFAVILSHKFLPDLFMAALVALVLLLGIIAGSDAAFCVCRSDVSTAAQQKTIDYACGAGADCTPISQNGACYNPNTVQAHCSYAANSYYQRKGQTQGACDFSGSAVLTTTDPSGSGCTYPATPSAAGTSTPTPGTATPTTPGTATPTTPTTPGSTTPTSPGSTTTPTSPGSTTPSTTPGTTTSPNTYTPTTGSGSGTGTGTGAGVLGGLGPSGNGFTDTSDAGFLPKETLGSLLTIFISCMVLLRG